MVPNKDGNALLHYMAMVDNDYTRHKIRTSPETHKELNVQNHLGQTPMHIAYIHRNLETALLLRTLGANPKIQDNKGKTPEDYLPY